MSHRPPPTSLTTPPHPGSAQEVQTTGFSVTCRSSRWLCGTGAFRSTSLSHNVSLSDVCVFGLPAAETEPQSIIKMQHPCGPLLGLIVVVGTVGQWAALSEQLEEGPPNHRHTFRPVGVEAPQAQQRRCEV